MKSYGYAMGLTGDITRKEERDGKAWKPGGILRIPDETGQKTAKDGEFCGFAAKFKIEQFWMDKDYKGKSCDSENNACLQGDINICGKNDWSEGGRAVNICMKESFSCDALPKLAEIKGFKQDVTTSFSTPSSSSGRRKRSNQEKVKNQMKKSSESKKGKGENDETENDDKKDKEKNQNKDKDKNECPESGCEEVNAKKSDYSNKKTAINLALHPNMKEIGRVMREQAIEDVKQQFRAMNLTVAYKSLFEILWYTQLPCFDVRGTTSSTDQQYGMLKACFWMGEKVPCAAIFRTVPTDRGMCCSFNLGSAQAMFKSKRFHERVESLQTWDKHSAFDPATENILDRTPRSGKENGLTVVLDARTDKISPSSVNDDNEGFFALVHPSNSYPLLQQDSIIIPSGQESEIKISPFHVTSGNDLISAATPDQRFCLFGNELKLNLHKEYTQSNCKLECSLMYAQENMNKSDSCIPWYFPTQERSEGRMCTPQEAFKFGQLMKLTPSAICAHCLPDCVTTKYSSSLSLSETRKCDNRNVEISMNCNFGSKLDPPLWGRDVYQESRDNTDKMPPWMKSASNIREWLPNEFAALDQVFEAVNTKKPTYDAYKTDISLATFYFDSPICFEYTRDATMTVIDFISKLGGMAGVCIGFSLLSAAEIVYWFTIRLVRP